MISQVLVRAGRERGKMRKGQLGFSLIELLIVVAVILVIAAIAIPNLLRSRAAANQASAVGSLHLLNTAEVTYMTTYSSYSPTLGDLGPPDGGLNPVATAAGLLDSILSGGSPAATQSSKSGYTFIYVPGVSDASGRFYSYSILATPNQVGTSGNTFYYTDQVGVIRENTTAVAGSSDSPLAG